MVSDFARRYAAAWSSQNPESVAEFFAERGSLRVNGGEPAVGRAAIATVARGFMTDFPDMIVTCDRLVPKGARVEFHWTLAGTYAGTGKKVRISGHEDWRLGDDGLVAESLGHFDAAEYARQLESGV
jgi:hypothetical protein